MKLTKKDALAALRTTPSKLMLTLGDAVAFVDVERPISAGPYQARLTINTAPPDEPPQDAALIHATARQWAAAISCSSGDDTRPHLAQLRLDFGDGTGKLISTDGHRMALVGGLRVERRPFQSKRPGSDACDVKNGWDLPALDLSPFMGSWECEVYLWRTPGPVKGAHVAHLEVRGGRPHKAVRLTGPVEDYNAFPLWAHVVPKSQDRRFRARTAELLDLADRCPGAGLVFDFSKGGTANGEGLFPVSISADNPPWSCNAKLLGKWASGEPHPETWQTTIRYEGHGINARYLRDAVACIGTNEIDVCTKGEGDPWTFEDERGTMQIVVMPMRM